METAAHAAEGWASNGAVRLHHLRSGSSGTPHVFLPGTFGYAEDYMPEMAALAPRRCFAVSLRGRGHSDKPATGYAFEDHVADFAAIVTALALDRFSLMAYSMGAAWALAYALQQPSRVSALVLGDYPARYKALKPGWAERAVATMPERTDPAVARALERDSREVVLWDRLDEIRCPVLILRGGQPGALVTAEVEAQYRQRLKRLTVVTLSANGRDLWKPDFDAYIGAVRDFIDHID